MCTMKITAVGGAILMRAHQPDAAIRYLREARSIYQSIGPNDDLANIASCSAKMGEAASLSGDSKSAKSYFHEALFAIESLPPGQDSGVTALYTAADAYSDLAISVSETR